MGEFKRETEHFFCKGVNLTLPPDVMPEGKYPILRNVRVRQQGTIEARDGISAVDATPLDQLEVHSIRRLNDPLPGAAPAWTRVIGAGTKVYTGQAAFTVRDTGYSGDPLSLVPHRPERSPRPWIYVADRSRMRKIQPDGTDYAMGIAPPLGAPTAELAAPAYRLISDFEATAGWTNTGTAGALSVAARVNTTIARILYDAAAPAWACIQPTAADEGIQPGMLLMINGGGGTAETVLVQAVRPAITTTTIQGITYDSGAVGVCTIQLALADVTLARDTMILVGAGGTIEPVRVLSVTDGPPGFISIRCSTVNTQPAGVAVVGLPSFRAYCLNAHVSPESLATNYVQSTVATGLGYLSAAGALNLAYIGVRPTRDDDFIHISISVDKPENVVEGKILLDCDLATQDFTQNYLFKAFRAADLTPVTRDTLTVPTTAQRAVQAEIIEAATSGDPTRGDLYAIEDGADGGYQEAPPRVYYEYPTSDQATTGAQQWTELMVRVGDLTRVGSDKTRGLANIVALRVSLNVTAATILRVDAWYVRGSYGPDATGGMAYKYRYRYRASSTGAKSLQGPAMRTGILPVRQRVHLIGVQSADPQVDKVDWERFGGNIDEWHWIGTSANSATPTLDDDSADLAVSGNQPLETDAYQPFPVADLPRAGTCNVIGSAVVWASGDGFDTNWARGTQIVIAGVPYELYAQPASTTRLDLVQSAGALTAVTWSIDEPILLGQPLPVIWGPSPDEGMFFACGDPRNAGTLYCTKGNDPDSAPEKYKLQVTTPSEPLMNGCMYDGKSIVLSSERGFWARRSQGPNVIESQELPFGRGLWSRWGLAVGPKIWFLTKDGIRETAGGEAVSITDQDLYPLFPHEGIAGVEVNGFKPPNMADTTHLRLSYCDGFLYFDYVDTDGHRQTLVYDTKIQGWFGDSYAPGQLTHYAEEGAGVHGLLSGGDDGRVYLSGGHSDAGSAIACRVRTRAPSMGDHRARKLYGDAWMDSHSAGADLTVTPGFDEYAVLAPPTTVNTPTKAPSIIDLYSGAGYLSPNMGLDIAWSSASVAPKLYAWEPALAPKPEDTALRATDWMYFGRSMWVQGCRISGDTRGVDRIVRIEYDGGQLATTLTVNHNGEIEKPYSFEPFTGHMARLVPTDAADWRVMKVEWVGEPMPEEALIWRTQGTSHDLPGYQHARDALVAYMSMAPVAISVKVDAKNYIYYLPASGGNYVRPYLPFEPMKGKAWEWCAASTVPFRLFKKDTEIRLKPWGETGGYSVVRPFGDESRESGARI